ncbi:unnamed protein product [Protopolystoma xenopodis]|uniref:Uncharacterized protein n=1 Tax=Protopolystoma xenopodis TaxID=117903 RepID=A0A448XJ45_9PLAT|nr:unnamed protein product [Protopolystoma xenopodis]
MTDDTSQSITICPPPATQQMPTVVAPLPLKSSKISFIRPSDAHFPMLGDALAICLDASPGLRYQLKASDCICKDFNVKHDEGTVTPASIVPEASHPLASTKKKLVSNNVPLATEAFEHLKLCPLAKRSSRMASMPEYKADHLLKSAHDLYTLGGLNAVSMVSMTMRIKKLALL